MAGAGTGAVAGAGAVVGAGAGTGAGVVGAGAEGRRSEMMSEMMIETMSEMMSVIVFPWLVWFVYIQVYAMAGEVSSYRRGVGVWCMTHGVVWVEWLTRCRWCGMGRWGYMCVVWGVDNVGGVW